jgi:glucokinase
MSDSRDCVVAVDIGGTTLKGAVFDRDGHVLAVRTRPTFGVHGRAADSVSDLIRQLLDLMRGQDRCPAAVGAASPGMVDTRRGVVISAVNLDWAGLPLRARLQEEFALPVALEHDARAAALGEQAARAGGPDAASPGPLRDFAFIPIGTGIAAAIVTGGRLVDGATGSAGEFGHIPVVPGGRPCACGQLGCIEAYASGPAIEARYTELGGGRRSAGQIAASAGQDERAGRVWASAVDALAAGLVALVALTDPAVVIIGGGVGQAGAALLDPLAEALAARLTWRAHPRLLESVLGPRAGLIGAGLCGWAGLAAPAPANGPAGLAAAGPAGGRAGAAAGFAGAALAGLAAATAPLRAARA